MNIRLAAWIGALAAAQPAYAAHWGVASTGADGTIVYVDNDSIVVRGDQRTFWAKFDKSHVKTTTDRDILTRYVLDCRAGNYASTAMIAHKPDGRASASWTQPSYQSPQWEPIAPDTLMEGIQKFVCPFSG